MTDLFFIRLGLYFLSIGLPAFHPSVLRYMDALSGVAFFGLLPLSALIAYYGEKLPRLSRFSFFSTGPRLVCRLSRRWHLSGPLVQVFIISIFIWYGRFSALALTYAGIGVYAYLSTWLIFKRRWTFPYYAEPFLFIAMVYKLIALSKASPELAETAAAVNVVYGVIAVFGFLSYAYAIYSSAVRVTGQKRSKLSSLPLAAFLPLALLLGLLFSPETLEHIPVLNSLDNILEPRPKPLDMDGLDSELNGDLKGADDGQSGAKLLSLPGSSWGRRGEGGSGGAKDKQYLIMVVRSPVSPLYLSERYLNIFDPEAGFRFDSSYSLNQLSRRQLMESWRNIELPNDRNRIEVQIDVYSTLSSEPSAYLPLLLEPVVKNDRYYPISYSYRTRSAVSELGLISKNYRVGSLSERDKEDLSAYLKIDVPERYIERFNGFIASLALPDGYYERIIALLRSFESFQYQVGYEENTSVDAIAAFCFDTKTGDCTEFSAAAALLGRLAGIPSRVVTGYLAANELRTRAHLLGLARLQQSYPLLAEAPLSELYLVTNAHKHAWVQYYLPTYGWVDFESTQFAIPPPAGMDPNDMDVVIPSISSRERPPPFVFPWALLLRAILGFALISVSFVYIRRWARLLRLGLIARKADERGAKALYRLLLIRMAASRYTEKAPALTVGEYAELYPELSRFAALYKTSVYGARSLGQERRLALYGELKVEYRRLSRIKGGFFTVIRELFGFRGWRLL